MGSEPPKPIGDNLDRQELLRVRRELRNQCGDGLDRVGRYALEHFVLFGGQLRFLDLVLPAEGDFAVPGDKRVWRVPIREVLGVDKTGIDESGLEPAAVSVLTAVHRHLVQHQKLPLAVVRELARWRRKGLDALFVAVGQGPAKEIVIKIADGKPLAICTGPWPAKQRTTQTFRLGPISSTLTGCYSVFPDQKRASAVMWPSRCPRCDKRTPASEVSRKVNLEREHDKRVRARIAHLEAEATVYGSTVTFRSA